MLGLLPWEKVPKVILGLFLIFIGYVLLPDSPELSVIGFDALFLMGTGVCVFIYGVWKSWTKSRRGDSNAAIDGEGKGEGDSR